MHPDPTWIVVADHQAARFFLRSHWGDPISEFTDLAESADFIERPLAASESDVGEAALKTLDPDEVENAFLHRVAKEIDESMTKHAAQGLVLCAPPKELCLLRSYISDVARSKLSCEITRDLVGEKVSSIDAVMRHLKA
jgi:protein required for attachment to host cells